MREQRPRDTTPRVWWTMYLPLALVVVALFALVALPVLGGRYTEQYHYELRDVAEPARTLVAEVQLALAIEGRVAGDFARTGDAVLLQRYREAVAREVAAYELLDPLAIRLGAEVVATLAAVRERERVWRSAVDSLLVAPHPATTVVNQRTSDAHEQLLASVAELDEAVRVAARIRHDAILKAERAERLVRLLLAFVALIAALLIAWLGRSLHRVAAEAERRRIEIESLMESRARLVRGLTHDLKNPLNAVDGHAQLLQEGLRGALTAEQRSSVERIRGAVRAAMSLLNDLLEFWRAEAGYLSMEPVSVDVGQLVLDIVEEHRAEAQAAGHTLFADVPVHLPHAFTDPRRVHQVLGNLLSNAIKYTPAGGRITVDASVRSRGNVRDAPLLLSIRVIDTGPGIPEDQQELVFEEFTRLHGDGRPGAGLGLAIARKVSRLLGGELDLASTPGFGSTFTLTLPVEGRRATDA